MNKHIITIAGDLGSGKSSTAKLIAKKLGYVHYSAGDLMRQLGKERGVDDIREFNRLAEQGVYEVDVDELVDGRTKQIADTEDKVVFDGHMAGVVLPSSFRVYLSIDTLTASKRILGYISDDRRASEHIPEDPLVYAEMLKERLRINKSRYLNVYGISPYDPELYDLEVNTGELGLEEVVGKIIGEYEAWLETKS